MLQLVWRDVNPRSLVKVSVQFSVKMNMLIQGSCPSSNCNAYVLICNVCFSRVIWSSCSCPKLFLKLLGKFVFQRCWQCLQLSAEWFPETTIHFEIFWNQGNRIYVKKCQVKNEMPPGILFSFFWCVQNSFLAYIYIFTTWLSMLTLTYFYFP